MTSKHHPCFLFYRCCECSTSLSHWYYEKDGRLFCKKDYWVKFGELCHGCNDPITTGLIMVTTSSVLASLVTSLAAGAFIASDKHCVTIQSVDVFTPWPPALHFCLKLAVTLTQRLYYVAPTPSITVSDCWEWKLRLLWRHLRGSCGE